MKIEEILAFNSDFVKNKTYEKYSTSKFPDKKIAIVTCMDTRLIKLLPAALGLKNGDAKIIKNAGGVISHPFGSAIRSLIIAIYELNISDILVIGHTDCGARYTDSKEILKKMKNRGISQSDIDMLKYCGVDFDTWLGGFNDLCDSVRESTKIIAKHPLIPSDVKVYGMIMDSHTGQLERIA